MYSLIDAIVNSILFKIANSICSLLAHGKAIYLCILTLYPANLTHFISFKMFFGHFFGFFYIGIHTSVNKGSFISSLPVLYVFHSLLSSCVIILVRTSSTILWRNGDRVELCLVLSGKTSSFSPLNITLAAGFLWMFFIKCKIHFYS